MVLMAAAPAELGDKTNIFNDYAIVVGVGAKRT